MSWQTDRLGRDRGRGRTLAAAAPAEAPVTEEVGGDGGRSFGFRSGAANPTGMATQRFGEAVERGKTLGEPTSFNAGAGAPAPIGVIRGMKQTYATDTGGPQLEEFATTREAGQAYNQAARGRFMAANPERPNVTYPEGTSPAAEATRRFGEFIPGGATVAKIQAEKEGPGQRAERLEKSEVFKIGKAKEEENLRIAKEKNNVADFDRDLLGSGLAHFERGKGMTWNPQSQEEEHDRIASQNMARKEGPEAGLKHMGERRLARKFLTATNTFGPNADINVAISTLATNPAKWAKMVEDARKWEKAVPPQAVRQELPIYELPVG